MNQTDWIELLDDALPVERAIQFVLHPSAGGVDVFLGTSRAENNESGKPLLALDYEAYSGMAQKQMIDLARRARLRWSITKLAILHRTGRVALAEPSVVIAVSTPHRAESFEACRWLIDTLKAEVAVWKKEIWSDGGETWVEMDDKVKR